MEKTDSARSWAHVIIQFTCLGIIVLTGPVIANGFPLALEAVGVVLGLWAISAMKIDNLHITPIVGKNTKFITSGPYALIRHPMYTGLLVATLGMVLNYITAIRLIVWLILFVNLLLKLRFEEGLLLKKIDKYNKYTKTTFRLVPYLY